MKKTKSCYVRKFCYKGMTMARVLASCTAGWHIVGSSLSSSSESSPACCFHAVADVITGGTRALGIYIPVSPMGLLSLKPPQGLTMRA
jgi:hypothetical protein